MPTRIYLMPDKRSKHEIEVYIQENIQQRNGSAKNLHSTLSYTTQTPIFPREKIKLTIEKLLPISLNPDTYQFELFKNNNVLVLRYANETVSQIHKQIVNEVIWQIITEWPELEENEMKVLQEYHQNGKQRQIYPSFNPHITLAKNFSKDDIKTLPPLKIPITLDNLLWQI